VAKHDGKPQSPTDEATSRLWSKIRSPRARGWLAMGIVTLSVLAWLVAQFELIVKIPTYFTIATTYATEDEITCLNEWVLKIANENSKEAAEQTRNGFLDHYTRGFGHLANGSDKPKWANDVHVVRDTTRVNSWMVVIDMYPGASTKDCMEFGKKEMVAVIDEKPLNEWREWDNTLGRMLRPAEPVCYDFSEFERTNGKVLNKTSDVAYQRSLGSCAKKLKTPEGFNCWDKY
jgi:hypothetical protein